MRRAALMAIVVCTGCIEPWFGSDDEGTGGPGDVDPPPDDDEAPLPAGIWEPLSGAHISAASMATDGSAVWWATTRKTDVPETEDATDFDYAAWIHATSSTGTLVRAPATIDPLGEAVWNPDIVMTSTGLFASAEAGIGETLLRRYTLEGEPYGQPVELDIRDGGTEITDTPETELVATPDGRARYVASLGYSDKEVAVIELDANGLPETTRFAGARSTEEGGSHALGIAAVSKPDGSTIVAWDRNYYGCVTDRPQETFATTMSGTPSTPTRMPDGPTGERYPTLATLGGATYLAWESWGNAGLRIAISRYPTLETIIGEIPVGESYGDHLLALADAERGAIAWRYREAIHIVRFEHHNGSLFVGDPIVIPQVDPERGAFTIGLAHLGDDRYLLSWIELGPPTGVVANQRRDRLFATEVDLVRNTMRPAPPLAPMGPPPPSKLRCP